MKIRVTSQEDEIEGDFEIGYVSPSGNSAHIPIKREHLGKIVKVVIPSESAYFWFLGEEAFRKTVSTARAILSQAPIDRMTQYKVEALRNIQQTEFTFQDIKMVWDIIRDKEPKLAKKIQKGYNIE